MLYENFARELGACEGVLNFADTAGGTSHTQTLSESVAVITRSQSPRVNSENPQPVPTASSSSSSSLSSSSRSILDMTEHEMGAEVRLPGIEYPFPAPADFDEVDAMVPDSADISVLSRATWFDKHVVTSTEVGDELDVYTYEAGYFPAFIHQDSLERWAWQRAFCIRNDELHIPRDRLPRSVKEDFISWTIQGLNCMFGVCPIRGDVDVDAFVYRTCGEIGYVTKLLTIPNNVIAGWEDSAECSQAAICFFNPLLRV